MVQISVSKDIKNTYAGVYAMLFSNGCFYIGASKQLGIRVKTQKLAAYRSFNCSCSLALRKMSGFDGHISFILLAAMEYDYKDYNSWPKLLELEQSYIKKHIGNEKMLNQPAMKWLYE